MPEAIRDAAIHNAVGIAEAIIAEHRQGVLLKAAALRSAISNSADFSRIATDVDGRVTFQNPFAPRNLSRREDVEQ